MSKQDDGGPAFPCEIGSGCMDDNMHQTGNTVAAWYGMPLRDYLAAHSVQPGAGEICATAGVVYRNGSVWSDEHTRIAGFEEWFNALPLKERLGLFARVKYAMADAMLEARKA